MQVTVGHLITKPPHRHSNKGLPYWIMGVTVQGRVRVTVGREEYWSGRGTMTVTQPGVAYEVLVPPEDFVGAPEIPGVTKFDVYEEYYGVVGASVNWPQLCQAWPVLRPGVWRIPIRDAVRLKEVIATWKSAHEEARSPRPRAKEIALLSLQRAVVIAGEDAEPQANAYDLRVRAAIALAHQKLAEPLTVEQMARAAHLSVSRFAHRFSEEVGVSPMRYLEEARIARAKELLRASGAPIRQICLEVGFQSPFHFSRRFQARVGVSPSAYRQTDKR
jgi:AraC-like DNA-binding protein